METKIRSRELLNGERRAGPQRRQALLYGGATMAAIWLAVIAVSVFAPDLVTGSEQDHFPLGLVIGPLAGAAATGSVARAYAQLREGTRAVWFAYALTVGVVWLAVALLSIFLPVNVTGADPTRFPVAVVVAPIAGAVLTRAITELFIAAKH